MAQQPHPDDPYRSNDLYRPNNPSRANSRDDDLRPAARLDNELQVDPELAEGPASGGRIALFAVGIALVLGAVFYGLNNSSMHQPGTASTAQNAAPAITQNTTPPVAPPGMRDVTPRTNTAPGTTTGAAPAQTPPPQAPTGPTTNAPASK
ncbi:MAG: hypothetical protein E8A46_03350 [Bradyrhizobium sp.]|jgi:hypothetical protein|uniref:hypothetical protein n=1 Tax=Bradyrhizobium sp. TaxID=376 RepID=UPI001211C213|nr:hypothetical protein [Bradyrhizobium sp.]THD56651.1 MAG: hypothetical protein E8A46_03350 [Bradyrhizobium sp.]